MDPRMGCCIDVGHTVRAGTDVVEAIHQVGPRLFNMHMKGLCEFPVQGKPGCRRRRFDAGAADLRNSDCDEVQRVCGFGIRDSQRTIRCPASSAALLICEACWQAWVTQLADSVCRSERAKTADPAICAANLDNSHRHPAVNHHVLAGDEIILHQRGNQRRNILRLAFFVQRDSILDIVLRLFRRKSIMKRRANDTGRNTVNPNASARQVRGREHERTAAMHPSPRRKRTRPGSRAVPRLIPAG